LVTPTGRRLKAIQKIEVNAETFPAVVTALDDERSAVQRWAAAILGTSGMPEVLEPLCRNLPIARQPCRTAGDALSDLGMPAIGTMCQVLEDRSARAMERAWFLNEAGDQTGGISAPRC